MSISREQIRELAEFQGRRVLCGQFLLTNLPLPAIKLIRKTQF